MINPDDMPLRPPPPPTTTQPAEHPQAEAWAISFAPTKTRKITTKEKRAMQQNAPSTTTPQPTASTAAAAQPDSNSEVDETPSALETNVNDAIDLAVAIPRNLETTREDIAHRTHFDMARFLCVVRQYKATCGMSSLCSVWNHLYSRLGSGTLPPVSQEEMMSILGFHPPFGEIRWGPFTGNTTLIRWFHAINRHFGVSGKAYYLYKAHGFGRTIGVTSDEAKRRLKDALQNPCAGVIYHCHNHYMVPIGWQEQPRAQIHCYAKSLTESETETHVFIGEVSRGKHTALHVVRWADIATDIQCQSPYFFNIRQREKGVQKREKSKRVGGNLHCLLCFRSDLVEEDLGQYEEGGAAGQGEAAEGEQGQSSGDEATSSTMQSATRTTDPHPPPLPPPPAVTLSNAGPL